MRLFAIAALASLTVAETISTSIIATVTQTRVVMRVYTETKKAVTNSSMTSTYSSYATGSSTMLWNNNTTTVITSARPTTQTFKPASTAAAPGRVHLDSAVAAIIGGAAAMLVL